jgi:hypothetical protein
LTQESAEQVLAGYIEVFGTKDGPIIRNLTDKVSNLAHQWGVFLYFFCGPKERVQVLNDASGSTGQLLQGLLWDNTLMRIRQLTDPSKTNNNDNLSLEHLVRIASETGKADLSELHAATLKICLPSKIYATKYLAHLDLSHAVGDVRSEVTRGQTTEAIKAICRLVQEFHTRVRNVTYMLMPIMSPDNEQQFLLRLHQGNQADEALETAAYQALSEGNWQKAKRDDIPAWVWEDRETRNFLDPI